MVNKVTLLGNLGKDPEVKTFDNGKKVANLTLATSEKYKNKSGEKVTDTEWHNVVLYSPFAEIAEKYLKKGSQIFLEGKIKSRSYDDKDGNKRYVTEVIGRGFQMLGSKSSESSTGSGDTSLNETDIDDLPF